MKLDISKIKKIFKAGKIFQNCGLFLERRNHWILLCVFIILAGYLAFIWHSYIYDYHWEEYQKQEYLKTKEKDSSFSKARFNDIVLEFQKRKEGYRKNISDWPDIFRLK